VITTVKKIGSYDESCDLWSIGVLAYFVLSGSCPFRFSNEMGMLRAVKRKTIAVNFPSEEWQFVSGDAKEFIQRLLNVEANERPTAADAMEHPWFENAMLSGVEKGTASEELLVALNLAHVGNRLQRFSALNKIMRETLRIIASAADPKDLLDLEAVFAGVDRDEDGMISSTEWGQAISQFPGLSGKSESSKLVDGSDHIDHETFIAAGLSTQYIFSDDAKLRMAFDQFDRSGSGTIVVDELEAYFGGGSGAHELLGHIDINGSGTITFEEFKAFAIAALHSSHGTNSSSLGRSGPLHTRLTRLSRCSRDEEVKTLVIEEEPDTTRRASQAKPPDILKLEPESEADMFMFNETTPAPSPRLPESVSVPNSPRFPPIIEKEETPYASPVSPKGCMSCAICGSPTEHEPWCPMGDRMVKKPMFEARRVPSVSYKDPPISRPNTAPASPTTRPTLTPLGAPLKSDIERAHLRSDSRRQHEPCSVCGEREPSHQGWCPLG
jgi:Ca2+-binding EF-hand superfamily protein